MSLLIDRRVSDGGSFASINRLLRDGLKSLDPTATERELAIQRYKGLGKELDEVWSSTRGENRIFAQGSFRLGTVTRRLNGDVDLDIDCVAVRDIDRSSITQEDLKREVGLAVKSYARKNGSGSPTVTESDRCWTLSWPGMHIDVLPAIPVLSGLGGLLITDRSVRAWQHSNPEGYASWFRERMAAEFLEEQVRLSKALDVEDVPEWRVKTTLQRSVQALKRHRDLYFVDQPERRPSSVVITTLAAKAYVGGASLVDVLRQVARRMPEYIEYEDGVWSLPNPVEPDENFTDYWAIDPELPKNFTEWMAVAQRDFAGLDGTAGLDAVAQRLEKAFGSSVSRAAIESTAARLSTARATGGVSISSETGFLALGATAVAAEPARVAKPNNFYGGPAR